jgi:hypothetical protein
MPIEEELQAVLDAAPYAQGQMLIDPDLIAQAAAEIVRLRKDLADERAMKPRRVEALVQKVAGYGPQGPCKP